MDNSKVFSVMLRTGEIIMGIETGASSDGMIMLSYPIIINPIMTQGPDGKPQQQMQIGPYFPTADYDHKEGLKFPADAVLFSYPAIKPIADAHTNYVTSLVAQQQGLVTASSLPENSMAVSASDMTDGQGLRISD